MASRLQRASRSLGSRKPSRTETVRSRLQRSERGARVRDLQGAAGNQATTRWLRAHGIHPRLTVGPAGDSYEREADRMADTVMRMPDVRGQAYIGRAPGVLQRLCRDCEEEQRIQSKSAGTTEPPAAGPGLESYLTASRGGGQPLPVSVRAFFEPRFDRDLGGVRVHTDARAARAASDIGAQAFTTGANIYFGADRFVPGSAAGDWLLAHELTHDVQQTPAADGGPLQRFDIQRQPQPPGPPDPPDPPDFGCSFDPFFDKPQDFLDCCAKTPLGRGCSKDLIDAVCKIPGVNCGDKPGPLNTCPPGFKPGATKEHKGQCCQEKATAESAQVCCDASRIASGALGARCCPPDTFPDAAGKNCVTVPPPPPPNLCLPGQSTTTGECCRPPLVPQGSKCVSPPPPPPIPKPLPSPLEIFFQKDRPKASGSKSLGDNLTAEGNTNFSELVAALQADPALKVQLVGRASPEGTDEYNLALGKRRAELIADALVGAGIDASRIANPAENELRSECEEVRPGLFTCGEAGATGARDRQVLSRIFRPNP